MTDLISRQAVKDLIMETDPFWCEGMTRAIFEGIKRLPTIEPPMTSGYVTTVSDLPPVEYAPIVRCKDCKWCSEHYDTDGNAPYWICKNWDRGTDADGFCYEAERSEE